MDPIVKETMDVILEFIDGFSTFLTVLTPSSHSELDYYCTGVIFGLQGSKILVKVANTLGDKKDILNTDKVGGWFENLGKGILNTAAKTY